MARFPTRGKRRMTIDGAQCRAARAMLGWTQEHVAAEADVAHRTIVAFEQKPSQRRPMPKNLEAIRRVFEAAGIIFIDENGGGRGVRFETHTEEPDAADEAADGE